MDSVRNLCEAIVLQAMEELLSEEHVEENLAFLLGEGMNLCSSILGIDRNEQEKILDFTFRHGHFEDVPERSSVCVSAA